MKYQDIQVSDIGVQQQFVQKWLSEDYAGALALLSNTALSSKKFVSTIFSTLAQTLLVLEEHYFTEFPDAMEIKLSEYNNAINKFIYKQAWDSTVNYEVGNYVLYNEAIYACIEANLNHLPTETQYWAYLGLKGEKGADGVDANIRYQWSDVPTYNPKDVVYHDEWLWYCSAVNTNVEPTDSATQWVKFLSVPSARIVVSGTSPTNPKEGLVWMKIIS